MGNFGLGISEKTRGEEDELLKVYTKTFLMHTLKIDEESVNEGKNFFLARGWYMSSRMEREEEKKERDKCEWIK